MYLSAAVQQVQQYSLQKPDAVALISLQSHACRHLPDLRQFWLTASASPATFKLCSWSCAVQLPICSLLLGCGRWLSLLFNCAAGDSKSGNKRHSKHGKQVHRCRYNCRQGSIQPWACNSQLWCIRRQVSWQYSRCWNRACQSGFHRLIIS